MNEAEYQVASLKLSGQESDSLKSRVLSYALYLALFYAGSVSAALLSNNGFGQTIALSWFAAILLVFFPLNSLFNFKIALPIGMISSILTVLVLHWIRTQVIPSDYLLGSINQWNAFYVCLYFMVLGEVSLILVRKIMKTKISMF